MFCVKKLLLASTCFLCSCQSGVSTSTNKRTQEVVEPIVLAKHDYSMANSPNERTALAYLYTAWNDKKIQLARQVYWVPGSFSGTASKGPPKNIGSPKYTIKKVIEEGNQVVVLAFVEGVGLGDEITTIFGTPGGTKIGDAVVEIFQFNDEGLIEKKWDIIEPLSDNSYDFK